jgi:chromosome transmission fidelity protein 18
MDSILSPLLPSTSDPALYDDWHQSDPDPAVLPSSTYSDELEAIHLIHQESIDRKNKDGQVIQHRAWKAGEAFRSDPDHLQGSIAQWLSLGS